MQEQASVAILSSDYELAYTVASQLTAMNPTRITLLAPQSLAPQSLAPQSLEQSSQVTSHFYYPVQSTEFHPPEVGTFILWGTNCLVLVVESSRGLDSSTIALANFGLVNHPVVIAITGLDHERSNFEESLAVCQRVFGADRQVVATSLPVFNDTQGVQGILNLLSESIQWMNIDGDIEQYDLEREHYELIEGRRNDLLNALTVSTIDDFFAQSLIQDEHIDQETLYSELVNAAARCELIPVLALTDSIGLNDLASLTSDLGVGNSNTWSPFPNCDPTETIGTVLPNGLIRVWQGPMTAGPYFSMNTSDAKLPVTVSTAGNSAEFPGGRVISAAVLPDPGPGATISTTGIALLIPADLD